MFKGLQVSGLSDPMTVGETVTVICSFDLDLTSIQWLYNGVVIMSSTTPQISLTFSPVNDSIHNRQYTCRAVTPYGTQEEARTIRVQGKILKYKKEFGQHGQGDILYSLL